MVDKRGRVTSKSPEWTTLCWAVRVRDARHSSSEVKDTKGCNQNVWIIYGNASRGG